MSLYQEFSMATQIANYLNTGDQAQLEFKGALYTYQAFYDLYCRLANTTLKEQHIETISKALFSQLPPAIYDFARQINSYACNLAESYKIRHFALLFDPSDYNVYERLIDRAATVRNEAAILAIRKGGIATQKIAQRLVAVLQNSDDRFLRLVIDEWTATKAASSEYFNQYISQYFCKVYGAETMFYLQIPLWDIYLRQPESFAKTLFERFLANQIGAEKIVDLATQAVLRIYKPNLFLPDSICWENNRFALNYTEHLLRSSNVNANLVKMRFLEWLKAPHDAEVTESYGFCYVRCWLGCEIQFVVQAYKDCKAYQATQNKLENTAIFACVLAKVVDNLSKPEWADLCQDIIVNYLSRMEEFSPEKHVIFVDFLAKALEHSKLAQQNAKTLISFASGAHDALKVFNEHAQEDVGDILQHRAQLFSILHIAIAMIGNIAAFDLQCPEITPLILKLRNTLGKLSSNTALRLFNFGIKAEYSVLRDFYAAVLLSVNVTLITPGAKDYNFYVINEWAGQLLQQLDVYSAETFLKSLVYVKNSQVSQKDQYANADLVFLTVLNCVDLINLQLLFKTADNLKNFLRQFGRLIYHLTSSATLRAALNGEDLLLNQLQPVYAKLLSFCAFQNVAVQVGCVFGLLIYNLARGSDFICYLLKHLVDAQMGVEMHFQLLAGICCATSTFRFGEEPVETVRKVICVLAQANIVSAVFLCAGKDKQVDQLILRTFDQQKDQMDATHVAAVKAYLQHVGLFAEEDPARYDAGGVYRKEFVKMLTAICKMPASFLDAVYE